MRTPRRCLRWHAWRESWIFPLSGEQKWRPYCGSRILGSGPGLALENLDRLEKGAVAIVSGQQVGLFSGPAYSFYKALAAVQLAAELKRSGVEAVPVFWMATEDHDIEEVRHTSWFQDGELRRFALSAPDSPEEVGRPVGKVLLGPQVEEQVHEAAELLVKQGSLLLAQQLRESYRAGETYGSAFARLFARLFSEQGLILLEPMDAGLHRIAAPLYRQAMDERDALNEKLLQRGKQLESAEYAPQVKVTAKSTLLFYMGSRAAAGHRGWQRREISSGRKAMEQSGTACGHRS